MGALARSGTFARVRLLELVPELEQDAVRDQAGHRLDLFLDGLADRGTPAVLVGPDGGRGGVGPGGQLFAGQPGGLSYEREHLAPHRARVALRRLFVVPHTPNVTPPSRIV